MNNKILWGLFKCSAIILWVYLLFKSGATNIGMFVTTVIILITSFFVSLRKIFLLYVMALVLYFSWKYFESIFLDKCSFANCNVDLSGTLFIFGVPLIALILLIIQLIQNRRNK